MLLNEIPWTIPLTVRLSNGLTHSFASVYEALDFLENEWPLRRGERYERAVRTCRRGVEPDDAGGSGAGSLHRRLP